MNTIKNTHTMLRTGLRQGGKSLLLAFLSITLLVSVATGKAKNVEEKEKAEPAASLFLPLQAVASHSADAFSTERPSKPDDHHSNGDDLPVRPPR